MSVVFKESAGDSVRRGDVSVRRGRCDDRSRRVVVNVIHVLCSCQVMRGRHFRAAKGARPEGAGDAECPVSCEGACGDWVSGGELSEGFGISHAEAGCVVGSGVRHAGFKQQYRDEVSGADGLR